MVSSNFDFYNSKETLEYYSDFCKYGIFKYEKYLIEKYSKKGSRILEIGCGTGRLCGSLENDYDVAGIDFSPKMIKEAKKNAPYTELMVMDVLNLDLKLLHDFDLIIFSFNGLMLIETYAKRKKALINIRKALKHTGVFIFSTPYLDNKINTQFWSERIKNYDQNIDEFSKKQLLDLGDIAIEEEYGKVNIHIPFKKEIESLLKEVGFEILFSSKRLDICDEGDLEEELDDNWVWVVKNE